MILGVGSDLIDIRRIEAAIARFGDRFIDRIFTEAERRRCERRANPGPSYARRFAAKEAVSKAFGTGIGKAMGWRSIDIQKKPSGEPFLVLSGPAEELATKRGVTAALVTLSHTEHHAVACVVLEGVLSKPR